jgi:hypothetical protein
MSSTPLIVCVHAAKPYPPGRHNAAHRCPAACVLCTAYVTHHRRCSCGIGIRDDLRNCLARKSRFLLTASSEELDRYNHFRVGVDQA